MRQITFEEDFLEQLFGENKYLWRYVSKGNFIDGTIFIAMPLKERAYKIWLRNSYFKAFIVKYQKARLLDKLSDQQREQN